MEDRKKEKTGRKERNRKKEEGGRMIRKREG
jgi:hypothetical protein